MKPEPNGQPIPPDTAGAKSIFDEPYIPSPRVPPTPMMIKSQAAFDRDLPRLLKTHYWQWAAYHGDECLGIARTGTELYQACLRRGLNPFDFVVLSIDESALEVERLVEPPPEV